MQVFYHLQGDAGEEMTHPNVFVLQKDDGVLLRDVRDSFPLRHFGTFHFRFRIPAEERGAFMWLDVTDPAMKVPVTAGGIHAKVLRLDDAEEKRAYRQLIRKGASRSTRHAAHRQPAAPKSASSPRRAAGRPQSAPQKPAPRPSPTPVQTSAAEEADFFTFAQPAAQPAVQPAAQPAAQPTRSPGGASGPAPSPTPSTPVERHVDTSHLTADERAKIRAELGGRLAGKAANVQAAMIGRAEQLYVKQQQRVLDKRTADADAAACADRRHDAQALHGDKLKAWAYDESGGTKNVRTLLSTMHTVMWEGAKWKPVGMAELIQPAKIKRAYYKAMLVVHPDKNGDKEPGQQYIAERVFETLNEAWERFQKEG